MGYKEFQLLMICWKLGLVDTFSVLKFCVNGGSQYIGIVLSSAAGNFSDIGPKILFEPIIGLGTSYQYVSAAATAIERRQRIAILASFFAASGSSLAADPTTNAAIGGAIASKIGYMKAILSRGGYLSTEQYQLIPSLKDFSIIVEPIKTTVSEVHPHHAKFNANSRMIIDNMFQEHSARRCRQACTQKIKTIAPTYIAPIASTQINTTALVGWTVLGVGLIGVTTFGALYLFQRAERKCCEKTNDKVLIDKTY